MEFVGACGIAGAAMHAGFKRWIVGRNELASLAAVAWRGGAGHAAIGAQAAGRGSRDRRRVNGALAGHDRGFTLVTSSAAMVAVKRSGGPMALRTISMQLALRAFWVELSHLA